MSVSGIFNVQIYNVLPTNSPSLNTANLQTLVSDLLTPGNPLTNGQGGTLQFPSSGTYQFNGTITIGPDSEGPPVTQPYSLLFMGTGAQSQPSPVLQMTENDVDLFLVDNNTGDDNNIGGILFQDLNIQYTVSPVEGAAIRVLHSQNVRIERVIFSDAFVVFTNALEGIIRECTFIYEQTTVGTAISITDEASHSSSCNEISIEKCNIRASTGNVPNTLTAVVISACKHATVRTLSVSDLNQGILVAPTAEAQNDTSYVHIDDCQIGTAAVAVLLQPVTSDGSALQDTRISNSSFSQGSGGTYSEGGIYIDTNGGNNSLVDTVRIIGCTSSGWAGPGLQINAGQNIQVIGGRYSGNGSTSAGIAITGSPVNISVVGSDLSASYLGGSSQQYAILVSGSPTMPVAFKDCFMLGYSSPVGVTGSPANLQIVNCNGYNDQGVKFTPAVPTGAFYNTTFGYYGPITFYVWGGSAVTVEIGTLVLGLATGSFYLPCNVGAQITHFGTAPSFGVVGM